MAFRSDYDFQTVFKLLDYSSINLNCCIILDSHDKRKLSNRGSLGGGLGREDCHKSDTCIG